MAYGVYSDRGYREHILERNKNTNKTEVFTQEDQTFTGRKTFLSGVTTSDLEVQTVEVSESLKIKGKDIIEIIDYLPNDVSEENKLTTEDFVNSSIVTNTAYFRGTFDSVEDLEAYEGEKTNNDYAFVRTADEFGAISFNRYKYNSQSESWEYEYTLNNSSFTSAQWDAINSGITAELVAKIGDGSAIVPSITEAEYEEIPDKNDGQIREIMDAEGFPVPFAIMNDEMTTSANVLSAQETENRIVAKVTEHPYIMHTVEYGTKWYRLYSDGWCEQGDYGTLNGSESPVQVTFLIPFKTINYSLAIALNENISSSPYWNDFGYDRTENGFKLRKSNKTSWIASGFVDLNNIPEIN